MHAHKLGIKWSKQLSNFISIWWKGIGLIWRHFWAWLYLTNTVQLSEFKYWAGLGVIFLGQNLLTFMIPIYCTVLLYCITRSYWKLMFLSEMDTMYVIQISILKAYINFFLTCFFNCHLGKLDVFDNRSWLHWKLQNYTKTIRCIVQQGVQLSPGLAYRHIRMEFHLSFVYSKLYRVLYPNFWALIL